MADHHTDHHSSAKAWFISFVLIMATIIGAVVFVQFMPIVSEPTAVGGRGTERTSMSMGRAEQSGVEMSVASGEVRASRVVPQPSFLIDRDESLDVHVSDPTVAEVVSWLTGSGAVRQAAFGARVRGGRLRILLGDEEILSQEAGADAREVWSDEMSISPNQRVEYVMDFEGGEEASRQLRPLWRPAGAGAGHPLPADDPTWAVRNQTVQGLVRVQTLQCARCHQSSDPSWQATLTAEQPPLLGRIGARVRPAWLRNWLRNPRDVNPGAHMPDVFTDSEAADETIEDIVHYLVSLGGPIEHTEESLDRNLITTGMVAYHRVGCVACHGPLEPLDALPGGRRAGSEPRAAYTTLDHLRGKTTHSELTRFLKDPLQSHPGGRMPDMVIEDLEAEAIAAYLSDRFADRSATESSASPFMPEPARVERGREAFIARGCSTCHELGPNRTALPARPSSLSLESIAGVSEDRGCLSGAPLDTGDQHVDYDLTDRDRLLIRSLLESIQRDGAQLPASDELAATMIRLNCVACHEFHGYGGPERAITGYFESVDEAEMGDEGRLPPTLTDVGAKLYTSWIRDVLENEGTSRPYMATRMPQFGTENVAAMPDLFARAAGVSPGANPENEPEFSQELAQVGRDLVGAGGGMNCITCHEIAGHSSTGVPGPDLAQMAGRLRYDYFRRLMLDTKVVRPTTRMTDFFVEGETIWPHLDGEFQKQVDSLWAYLSLGEMLPLPDGLPDPGGFEIRVEDRPVVFRTFMSQAGVRAIACGFPEQVHCAFDADQVRLAIVWEGSFLSAQGAWGGRGGSTTNPDQPPAWTAPDGPTLIIGETDAFPESFEEVDQRIEFTGYRLDDQHRPIMLYEIRRGDDIVKIEEQPLPQVSGQERSLLRRFTLKGAAGLAVQIHPELAELRADSAGRTIELDDRGHAMFALEVTR